MSRDRDPVSKTSLVLQSVQIKVFGRRQDPAGSCLMSSWAARALGSAKAKPHQELSSEALFPWTAACVSQHRTMLHTGTLHDARTFSISQYSSFELMWSAESSWRSSFPDTDFHCKVLWYLWNRNVLASLTAYKISTITSNAIKLAFSLVWAQFTWGHWSKARLYLCLCIAHSGDQGKKNHTLVMCWILQGMKITTHSVQHTLCVASSVLCSYTWTL